MRLAAAVVVAGLLPAGGAAAAGMADMVKEPVAVLQGLDKITGRVSRFDATVDQPVSFGTLSIVVRDCEKSAPESRPENAAFLQIYENRPGEARVRRFSGWMFSSSPALSALEHPVYDVNLLACAASPSPPTASAPAGNSSGKAAR